MKRAVSFILAFALCLSLCACGKNPTIEELQEMPRLTGKETSARQNPVKAKEERVGKVQNGGGRVAEITSEYVIFEQSNGDIQRVYLPEEEISQLKLDRCAYYIGLIDDYTYDKTTNTACLVATGHITRLTSTLKNAVVTKIDEIIYGGIQEYCIVKSVSSSFPVLFEDKSVLRQLEVGDTISIEFTYVYSDLFECGYYLENAKLIEP